MGRIHGETKDSNPPIKAPTSVMFSVTITYFIMYPAKLSS